MKKLVGIIGSGLIGTDPYHPKSWSGSSSRFFLECKSQNILHRAFGVEVSKVKKYWFALKNYSQDRNKLITQYLMDTGYRNDLTSLIQRQLTEEDFEYDMMQLGAIYDVPALVKNRTKCYSYNDGNFAMALNSPNFPSGVSKVKIERTFKYEQEVNSGLDKIFTMSEYLRESFIKDYDMPPDKVISIGAGINLDFFPECNLNKDYSKLNIVFIGIDFERKGGFDLIKAFKIVREKLPNATLHIVGPHNRIQGISDLSGVVWHGFLDKSKTKDAEKLNSIFAVASLFVMPSLYEPFGIAPLEAMAHEIPCIVSNAWALPEIVLDNICGRLVTPGNWEEIAETMISLLKCPSTLEKFGKAGRQHVENNFTWKKVVGRLKISLSSG